MGIRKGKLKFKPHIEMLEENPPRKGFFELSEYMAVRDALPDWLADPMIFGFHYAWRKENIFEMEWKRVDTVNWSVRVDAGDTKNKESIEIPFRGECLEMMQRRWEMRRLDCSRVFHRDGKPLSMDIRDTWRKACIQVGLGRMIEVERRGKNERSTKGNIFMICEDRAFEILFVRARLKKLR